MVESSRDLAFQPWSPYYSIEYSRILGNQRQAGIASALLPELYDNIW